MNIAFFLFPKNDVVYINADATLRQTIEKMEYHRYTAVPIIDEEGTYIGTVTEGDLLWFLKNNTDMSLDNAHQYLLKDIPLRRKNESVPIDAAITDLISLVKKQNFVPVVDDMHRFIGIVRRSDIIDYCMQFLNEERKKELSSS